jgi:hypothetical protein
MNGRMNDFRGAFALAALALACSPTYVVVQPNEPLSATLGPLRADVTRLWLTHDVRTVGLDQDTDLVVELKVTNDGPAAHQISPGSFSCLMELDPRHPEETRALDAGGGGAGRFRGSEPDEGSLTAPLSIAPGETLEVWAIFHGYRFADSDRPRRVTLRAPFDAGVLTLDLADPARGALRWQTPVATSAYVTGVKTLSLFGPALRATGASVELGRIGRRGPFIWDVGYVSTVLFQAKGNLASSPSSTSTFMGTGLTAHLAMPLLTWGTLQQPRQLGVYGGGSASLLIEAQTSADTDKMVTPHVYGLFTAEGGLEFDIGALPFTPTPFPLTPAGRAPPRWSFRVGYAQGFADGISSDGYSTTLRFIW